MVVVRCRMAITDLPPNTCTEDDAGASEDLRGPSARKQVEASISVRLAPPILQNDQASDLAPLVRGCSERGAAPRSADVAAALGGKVRVFNSCSRGVFHPILSKVLRM